VSKQPEHAGQVPPVARPMLEDGSCVVSIFVD
jgi:hypothetical protein